MMKDGDGIMWGVVVGYHGAFGRDFGKSWFGGVAEGGSIFLCICFIGTKIIRSSGG